MTTADHGDDRLAASEYVLALLEPPERRAFELALLDDPALAAEVWRAEEAMVPLAKALRPRRPSRRVWRAIARKALARADAAPPRRGRRAAVLWRTLAGVFALAAVAAGCLVAVLILRPETLLSPAPTLVAALVASDGKVTLARIASDGSVRAEPVAPVLAPGREPVLWLVRDGAAPVPLGVLSPGEPTEIAPQAPAAGPDASLAGARLLLTEEAVGATHSDGPTGATLAQGPIHPI